MKKLPKIWFLRFKTKEVFNELCLPYEPSYGFYPDAGITNGKFARRSPLGNYYYLPAGESDGEEITYEQFKASFEKPEKENLKYLIKLFKELDIK